nr:B3 domain-containing protein At1g05920-like [Ipomoea batatas]
MAACLFSCLEAKSSPPQQSTSVLTRMLCECGRAEEGWTGGCIGALIIASAGAALPPRARSAADFAHITLPEGSCRFDYLLAVCERERLLLEKEEQKDKQQKKGGCYNVDDDDDQYYLGGVDLNQSLITPSLPDKEEWKKKLMGSFYGCLSWHNDVVVKPVVQSKALSNTPESVISHSSGDDRASLKYDEAVAEEVNNSKKRKRGSSRVPNNGPEPPPGLPVEFRNFILQLAGNRAVRVEKLVIQKELTITDVNSTQSRLSIPARLVREEFLTEEEHLLLCQHNGKNVCSIEVPLITPMMEVAKVSLRRWEMKKGKGVSNVASWASSSAAAATNDKDYYFDSRGDRDNLAFGCLYKSKKLWLDGFLKLNAILTAKELSDLQEYIDFLPPLNGWNPPLILSKTSKIDCLTKRQCNRARWTLFQGGRIGTPKGLMKGGFLSTFSSAAAASIFIKQEYELQSGKSEGKYGNSACKGKEELERISEDLVKSLAKEIVYLLHMKSIASL